MKKEKISGITLLDENGDPSIHYQSAEEMFADFEIKFKKEQPFFYWFDEFYYKYIGKSIGGYSPHVIFTDFFDILRKWGYELKYAYQRVRYGYDDTWVWGVGYKLNDIMPNVLRNIKEKKQGIPMRFFDNDDFSDGASDLAEERYDKVLDDLIFAFEEMKILQDYEFDWKNKTPKQNTKEYKDREKVAKKKLKLLVDYYWEIGD